MAGGKTKPARDYADMAAGAGENRLHSQYHSRYIHFV